MTKAERKVERSLLGGLRGQDAAGWWLGDREENATGAVVLELAVIWGDQILDAGQFDAGEVTIGDAPGCTIAAAIEGCFPLVRIAGGVAEVRAPPAARLERWCGGIGAAVEGPLRLAPGERAVVRLGALVVALRFGPPAERIRRRGQGLDLAFGKALTFSAMGASFLLAVVGVTPREPEPLEDRLFDRPLREISFSVTPALKPPRLAPERRFRVENAPRAPREEGRFGVQRGTERDAARSRTAGERRADDLARVRDTGLLGALRAAGGAADAVLSGTGLGNGINQGLGGLRGGGIGDAHGLAGIGVRGVGPGGGGTGLSLGDIGTGGVGRGPGGGEIDLARRGKSTTRIIPGKTTVVGGLSREVIGAYIEKRSAEIRYCYERELQKHPELQGKVAVLFSISGTGTVSSAAATEDTLGDGTAARCIVEKVRRWRFPAPEGGGEVVVTYPWIFRAAGD